MQDNLIVQIAVTIALGLLVGLQREEKRTEQDTHLVGGVRTLPIVALFGYMLHLVAPDTLIPVAVGLACVGGVAVASYLTKASQGAYGSTTEMAMLSVYVLGVLVSAGHLWVATAIAVATTLLLHARPQLRQIATTLPRREITTAIQFLLLAGVVLPVLPDKAFTRFELNPFRIWLIVVAVSGLSYASYLVQRILKRRTALLTAILGGIYSSTVATIVLARYSRKEPHVIPYAGAMGLASALMYFRLGILIWVFNSHLGWLIGSRMILFSGIGAGLMYLIARLGATRHSAESPEYTEEEEVRNPLEIWTAFTFAAVFAGVTVAVRFVQQHLGVNALYALAAVVGTAQIEPFVLSITQTVGAHQPASPHVGIVAIMIATASHAVLKGIYAIVFGHRRTGLVAFALIVALGLAGLLLLIGL